MSDILGGLVSAGINFMGQERSFEQQKELQGYAQKYNTLMWNKANEYNTPQQQMLRFKSAGLNPNLIYGQMQNGLPGPSMGSPSSPSPAQAPAMSALETAQIGLLNAQEENIKANTDEIKQNISESGTRIDKMNKEIDALGVQMDLGRKNIDMLQKSMDKMDEEIKEIRANVDVLKEQKTLVHYDGLNRIVDYMWSHSRYQAEINHLLSQTNLNNEQARRITTLLAAELSEIKTHISLMVTERNTNMALRKLFREQARVYGIEGDNLEKQGQLFDREIMQWDKTYGNMLGGLDEDDAGGITGAFLRFGIAFQPFMPLVGQVLGASILRGGMPGKAVPVKGFKPTFSSSTSSTSRGFGFKF